MAKENSVILGGLLLIEMPEFGNFTARVQIVEGKTIWTQYYLNQYLNKMDYYGRIVHIKCYFEGNYYVFDAITEKNEIVDGLLMCKLTRTTEIDRIQRRDSFRVQLLFDVHYKIKGTEDDFKATKGVDISEAGMAMNSKTQLPKDTVLDIVFTIEDTNYQMSAIVMRSIAKLVGKDEIVKVGLKFLDASSVQIKELRRFVYKQQLKSRVVN